MLAVYVLTYKHWAKYWKSEKRGSNSAWKQLKDHCWGWGDISTPVWVWPWASLVIFLCTHVSVLGQVTSVTFLSPFCLLASLPKLPPLPRKVPFQANVLFGNVYRAKSSHGRCVLSFWVGWIRLPWCPVRLWPCLLTSDNSENCSKSKLNKSRFF